jgi:superoxide dismutase, Cu-Zn family
MLRTFAALSAIAFAGAVSAAEPLTAKAELKTADGKSAGTATLTDARHGVLIKASLENLPAGAHAFHIHAVGKCEAPFKTAGGHFNPDGHKHGIMAEHGKHAGDLPNITVPEGGKAEIEVFVQGVTLKDGGKHSVFHEGGTSLVIHATADDHKSDPAGNAGDRIACGVIVKG